MASLSHCNHFKPMKHPFEYQAPTPKSIEDIKDLRLHCFLLNSELEKIPNCREKSLAITKLEEVNMWANKAIVMTQIENVPF